MTPAARIQAAIEVLDAILGGTPAEQALTGWARGARYAGSKDRAAVRDHVFQALRCQRSYAALGGAKTGRGLMLGELRSVNADLEKVFSGDGHAPEPLTEAEREAGRQPQTEPEALDMPDWLWPRFIASLGEEEARRSAGLLRQRAPVALRVNIRKRNVPQAIEILLEEGILAEPDPVSDFGLIVRDGARRIRNSRAYGEGLVELQDLASQAAMQSLEIAPGARVLDFCAGGGGKTLALAARAEARWFAHDAAPQRMRDLPARAARAGVEVTLLSPDEITAQAPFDLVLCDAPCSGSGTWRRAPDAKWRFEEADLTALGRTQLDILRQARALLRPGGRLAYATCSVLREENEDITDAFLTGHPDCTELFRRRWSITQSHDGFYLSVFSC